jgi:DNA-directed RNA polymerase subunit RPC12/RpoP
MTIRVKCPSCQQTLKAEERHAGRTVRCPACRSPVTIPSPEPEPAEETLDPFAELAEPPAVEQREQATPASSPPKKKPASKPAEKPEPAPAPTVSEDEVGEWLTEGLATTPVAEEIVELPPQSPNWDGTTSTYDIAEIGPDDPPPPKKRRRKG